MTGNKTAEDQTVIFLHIPKVGGTTVTNILLNQYERDRHLRLHGGLNSDSIKKFRQLSNAEKRYIRIISGHIGFGIHHGYPCKTTYFTLLRDPVERVISHYYYVSRSPDNYLYERVTKNKISLEQYITEEMIKEINDSQVRFLSGIGFHFDFNRCPNDLLELAKILLDEFFIVAGLVEHFDETMLLLKRALNWLPPVYSRQNTTRDRPKRKEIEPEVIKLIKDHNRLDLKLYRYVKQNFTKKIKSMGPSFQSELKAFKLLNDHWQLFSETLPTRKMRVKPRLYKKAINDIIKRYETLTADKEEETAHWFLKSANELYPQEKKIKDILNSTSN